MKKKNKLLNLGHTIIDGPIAIFKPDNDFDWYEQDVFIKINITGVRDNINQMFGYESISIWTDDTMNKEKNFFQPIIRYARWIRTDDLDKIRNNKPLTFPGVEISLGDIKDQKKLENDLINFQQKFKNLQYIPFGLSLQRDVPDVEFDKNYTAYSIFFRNGIQSIEISSEPVSGDSFTNNVFELFNIIKKQMNIFNKQGWKEKYSFNFNSLIKTDFYMWDYSSTF